MDLHDFGFLTSPGEEPDPSISEALKKTIALLRQSAFFEALDDDELHAVARCISERSVPAGQVVIAQGAPGAALYLVESGLLKVEKDKGGRKLLLGQIKPGEAFGEMSLVSDAPTSATVTAVETSKLVSIGPLDLEVLLNWNPILASKMWRSFTRLLATRLRDMNERMVEQFGK